MGLILLPSAENLYLELSKAEVLLKAWEKVKAKGSAGGIDGIGLGDFEKNLEQNIRNLSQDLSAERYLPEPYKILKIPKGSGGFRELSLPSVRDKVVQQALADLIEPYLEKNFLDTSYAYRKNKGPLKAISRVSHLINNEKRTWVTICDIDSFFDTIDHGILFDLLSNSIPGSQTLNLVKLCIRMGRVGPSRKWVPISRGIPQGAIISPLLANLYLCPLDRMVRDRKYGYVRYADDFIVLSRFEEEAYRALQDVKTFLERDLKLTLNPGYGVKNVSEGFEFLGIFFQGDQKTITSEKLNSLKEKITNSIRTFAFKNPQKLKDAIEGIKRYYGQIIPQEILEEMDERILGAFKELLKESTLEEKRQRLEELRLILNQVDFSSSKFQLFRQRIIRSFFSREFRKPPEKSEKKILRPLQRDPVGLKKRQYQKLEEKDMELVVTQLGVSIGKSKRGIILKERGAKIKEISTVNLRGITILSPAISISSKVIRFCAENKIPIDFFGFDGNPYAKIYSQSESRSYLWMSQLEAVGSRKGAVLAKSFVLGKAKNQLNLVKYYSKYRSQKKEAFLKSTQETLEEMKKIIEEIKKINEENLELIRGRLFSIEGRIATLYWKFVEELLKENIDFQGRVRKGATDLLNSLLNYGYGILYSKVYSAILKSGLNPFISFLHKPQEGKPTLVYDLTEEFRQQGVDRPIFTLITKGQELVMEDGLLSQNTRKLVAEKVLQRIYSVENFRGKEARFIDIIYEQARSISLFLQGKGGKYRPYLGKW